MARSYSHKKIIGLTKEEYFKSMLPNRTYLLIENRSAFAMRINFDTHATETDGIEIPSGGNYERESSVPDNIIYMIGNDPANLQSINITEGYG